VKFLRRIVLTLCATTLLAVGVGAVPAWAEYEASPSSSWVPANGRVYAMAVHGDRVYLGGTFTSMRNPATGVTVARQRLAAVDATTGALITGWNPGANNTVRSLTTDGAGTVYVGGDFTSIASGAAQRLAALTPAGGRVPGWSANVNNTVRDLVVHGGGLFASGAFTTVNGAQRIGVARLQLANGALVTGWNARVTQGRVWAIAPSNDGSTLLLGGSFQALSGQSRVYLGSVSLATGTVTAWTPPRVCDSCILLDLTTADTSVYAAVGGPGGGRAASWEAGSGDRNWIVRGDGDVQAVDVIDNVLYAGGHFGPGFAGQVRHQLAALNASNGALLTYRIPFTGSDAPGIWAISAEAEALRIAGGFTGVQGSTAARYARFPVL
jgi:hypothetical protein